jgi:hypothetical protein
MTSSGGTTAGTSTAGTSGSTGGVETDGGAVFGLPCGDAGACSTSEYCVTKKITLANGPPTYRFSCDAVPACDAEPDCNCFTSIDGGVCYDAHVQRECDIASGVVECWYLYP